jgi:hypothetical protein
VGACDGVEVAACPDVDAGVATGGGVPVAAATGVWGIGDWTVGAGVGIGGGGGATSVTTGAAAMAFASAVMVADSGYVLAPLRAFRAGRPYELVTTGIR